MAQEHQQQLLQHRERWGIDLNRNFPYHWGCCGGSSGDRAPRPTGARARPPSPRPPRCATTSSQTSRTTGTRRSAPIPDDAAGVFIDLHSYGELVLWPWGYTYAAPPNANALRRWAASLAYFNGHRPEQSVVLYVTDGTTDDFTYGELGVASYTFEMGTDFFQDCTTFENTILPTNLQALLYAIRVTRAAVPAAGRAGRR